MSILNKIKTIEELSKIIQKKKRLGKRIAHCHGCFDLLHIGHIRHFQSAAKMADILIVTITSDKFINKGPGRPVFSEELRLESLANLGCIDFVALNNQSDAIELIKSLKSNYYVKGDDYSDINKDVTGKILLEKDAIESVGGKLRFTNDITFSSTELINENINKNPKLVTSYLKSVKNKFAEIDINNALSQIKKLKVLVIGDAIIDEYCYCHVVGTVTKYPTLSAVLDDSKRMLGGSIAVARHIVNFTKKTELVSILGPEDNLSKEIKESLENDGINYKLYNIKDSNTVVKRRYISRGYPNPLTLNRSSHGSSDSRLLEIGKFPKKRLNGEKENQIINYLKNELPNFDIVIITDFGHGFITSSIIDTITKYSKWWAVNAQTNSANFGFNLVTKYRNPDYICVDELEARLPFGDKEKDLDKIAESLKKQMQNNNIMITRGKDGLSLYYDNKLYKAPPLASKIVDTVGAGDAVLSLSTLCQYIKLDPELTAYISSCSGAVAAGILGNEQSVSKGRLITFMTGPLK